VGKLSNLPPGVTDSMLPGNGPHDTDGVSLYEIIHNEIEHCERRIKASCNEVYKMMFESRIEALKWVINQMRLEDIL
jgi:hypothetical protein